MPKLDPPIFEDEVDDSLLFDQLFASDPEFAAFTGSVAGEMLEKLYGPMEQVIPELMVGEGIILCNSAHRPSVDEAVARMNAAPLDAQIQVALSVEPLG